ncbi:HAD family hydrolase [Kribbella sp. NPDC026611]|uniref:HAD family hydrolase n=1 Tax=Kribbella sp. NPDC026611 TaxID=3154911 RepID=UPI0033D16583
MLNPKAYLLDFDGPVCDLFPSGGTTTIAADTRAPLLSAGVELPEELTESVQHLRVLRYAGQHAAPAVLEAVEQAAIAGEIEAARHAPITPGVREFLEGCAAAGKPVVVVSNNAAVAIDGFLEREELAHLVVAVLGRPYARPELMKPDPYRAIEAFRLLGYGAEDCCMVGDEPTDTLFARAAGVPSIAYAKSPQHEERLREVRPDVVVRSMVGLV